MKKQGFLVIVIVGKHKREFQFREPTLASAKALVHGLQTGWEKPIYRWSIQPRGANCQGISNMFGKLQAFVADGSNKLLASFKKSKISAK